MPASLIELRPDRRLLDHEFEGYKLNLHALPHFSHELSSSVDRVYPDEVQYSFVHAKLFALHNHLTADRWSSTYGFYYIDNKQQVRFVVFDSVSQTFNNKLVYDVPAHVERVSGHFNLCISFPSPYLAVVSDGTGYLHIVETGKREAGGASPLLWQTQHSTLVLGEGKYFIILDTRFHEKDGKETLHCLLQSVEHKDGNFISVLSWVLFENGNQSWKQISMKKVEGKGIVHYAAIESSCDALYIAADNPFKFTSDSEREICEPAKQLQKNMIYTWIQTTEDISITLQLQSNFEKNLLLVNVTPLAIKVSYAGNIFIDGKLRQKVDSELTTWNVQDNGQVDILITKSDSALWDELLEGGDSNGEQIMDASLVEEVHKRLAHLCSESEVVADTSKPAFSSQQLEECDVASEEDTVLVRLQADDHRITHRISLSMHQFLFSMQLETNGVPALALRHDVDACVWQPYAQLINSETWPVTHQGTLMAFGYVQSSKQNRKFVTCAPNFSYSVVCESSRHIFIYQSISNQDSQLRKRAGGVLKTVKVGQQHVFNINEYGEVLGIQANNEHLFVLTEKNLIAIGLH